MWKMPEEKKGDGFDLPSEGWRGVAVRPNEIEVSVLVAWMHKRLRVARDLIAQGMRTTDACFQCGYHDYSAFSRAYKKRFQVSPRADLTKGAK